MRAMWLATIDINRVAEEIRPPYASVSAHSGLGAAGSGFRSPHCAREAKIVGLERLLVASVQPAAHFLERQLPGSPGRLGEDTRDDLRRAVGFEPGWSFVVLRSGSRPRSRFQVACALPERAPGRRIQSIDPRGGNGLRARQEPLISAPPQPQADQVRSMFALEPNAQRSPRSRKRARAGGTPTIGLLI